MATQLRNTDPSVAPLAAAINSLKAQIGAASFYHLDVSEVVVTAATATDLPTCLAMCNNLLGVYAFSMADTLAHKVAGVALASYVQPTDLASAIVIANDIKAKYNTHRASTTYHYTADSTNAVASANATDLASLITLVNDLKTQLLAHMASGQPGKSIRVIGA